MLRGLALGLACAAWAGEPTVFSREPKRASAELLPPFERLLGPERLRGLEPPAASGDREAERLREIDGLGLSGERGVSRLGLILQDRTEPARLRVAAALALGETRQAAARAPLARVLSDPNIAVRFAAGSALGSAGVEGFEPSVLRALRSDPSWWVRYSLVVALRRARPPYAAAWLAESAAEDPQWQVRVHAARALGEFEDQEEAALGLGRALSDRNAQVRLAAAAALARVKGRLAENLPREGIEPPSSP